MSKTAAREIHRDDSPLFTGTHKGGDAATALRDAGNNFRAMGVNPTLGQYVENETQSTGGAVTAADEDTVTVDGVTWDRDDVYGIYVTATKDSFISGIWTDVSRGWKINHPDEIGEDGWRREDHDIDDHGRKDVWSPGFPEKH